MDEFVIGSSDLELDMVKENEAFAAISLNPSITWAKFILTDSLPNLNKERIPEDEFDNLIKTGIYMPIKMASGKIEDGHADAIPLGVISHLKKINGTIQGLAALWEKERPEDIKYIKERYASKQPLQLSWEVLYGNSTTNEDGVKDLQDTALRAVTLVGMPAYAGRTPIISVASTENNEETDAEVWKASYIDALPDSSFLYIESGGTKDDTGKTTPRSLRHLPYKGSDGKVDEVHLQNAIARAPQIVLKDGNKISSELATKLQNKARKLSSSNSNLEDNKLDELEKLLSEKAELVSAKDLLSSEKEKLATDNQSLQTSVSTLTSELDATKAELDTVKTELEALRTFKAETEKKQEEETKFSSIRNKFKEAGLERDEEYFSKNKEMLIGLPDPALDFMIQEAVSFSAVSTKPETTLSSTRIPPVNPKNSSYTMQDLATELKARLQKSKE